MMSISQLGKTSHTSCIKAQGSLFMDFCVALTQLWCAFNSQANTCSSSSGRRLPSGYWNCFAMIVDVEV